MKNIGMDISKEKILEWTAYENTLADAKEFGGGTSMTVMAGTCNPDTQVVDFAPWQYIKNTSSLSCHVMQSLTYPNGQESGTNGRATG